jgi:hypothetical protein
VTSCDYLIKGQYLAGGKSFPPIGESSFGGFNSRDKLILGKINFN